MPDVRDSPDTAPSIKKRAYLSRLAALLILAALAGIFAPLAENSVAPVSWNGNPAYATFSATTSSTLGPDERVCTVIFRLTSEVLLGSIQFEATYKRNVRFLGEGTDVECTPLAGQFWVVSDSGERIDRFTKVRAAMIDADGVGGPADLLACRVRYAEAPASDADIGVPVVEDASDPAAATLDPLPEVALKFDCPAIVTTTTTTLAPATPRCGRPVDSCGPYPSATDALVVLFAAVGILDDATYGFSCPLCRCDLDGSGAITATDALATLRHVVRIFAPTLCPPGPACENDEPPDACPF